MIQIRNVRDDIHRTLKVRAAQHGKTLSDYLLEEIEYLATLPTPEEIEARLAALPPLELPEAPSAVLRRMRDADA